MAPSRNKHEWDFYFVIEIKILNLWSWINKVLFVGSVHISYQLKLIVILQQYHKELENRNVLIYTFFNHINDMKLKLQRLNAIYVFHIQKYITIIKWYFSNYENAQRESYNIVQKLKILHELLEKGTRICFTYFNMLVSILFVKSSNVYSSSSNLWLLLPSSSKYCQALNIKMKIWTRARMGYVLFNLPILDVQPNKL